MCRELSFKYEALHSSYKDITLDIQHILRQGKGGNVKNEFLIPLEIIFYFGHTNSKVWRMEGWLYM